MPLSDVLTNAGTGSPAQMVFEVPNENTGVMLGFTDTVSVNGVAHNPAVGVKVYVAEFWSSIAAWFQVPVMPLSDVEGRPGTGSPAQMVSEGPKLKVGTVLGLTVTFKVKGVAHCPVLGVNVYVAEF